MIMKTTKEKIEVMQAYLDGKKIECGNDFGMWWTPVMPTFDWAHFDYRIKDRKLVPFDTAKEFLEAQIEHGDVIRRKKDGNLSNSFVSNTGDVVLLDKGSVILTSIGNMCGKYEFADGTPCGKEV